MSDLGDFDGARRSYERALAIREKVLGPRDKVVAQTLTNLAGLEFVIGNEATAIPLFRRALKLSEEALGPEHPQIAILLNNLAAVLDHRGEYMESARLFKRALSIAEKRYGPEHPEVAATLSNYSSMLAHVGDFAGARASLERAERIQEKTLPYSQDLAITLTNLGDVAMQTGDSESAQDRYTRAIAIYEKILGSASLGLARLLDNFGLMLLEVGDGSTARALLERAAALRKKILGSEHLEYSASLHHLAQAARDEGDCARARSLYERAVRSDEMLEESGAQELAESLDGLGVLLLRTGDNGSALSAFYRSHSVLERRLGEDHPNTGLSRLHIAEARWRLGQLDEASSNALRGEITIRGHFQRAARVLSEREALAYQEKLGSGLDVALSALGVAPSRGISAERIRRVWEETIRSRATVLDELASRHRTVLDDEAPEVVELDRKLEDARTRWSRVLVSGPDARQPGVYRQQLGRARTEMEDAERELASKSLAFRDRQEVRSAGFDQVAHALPPESAIVAYVRYNKMRKGGAGVRSESASCSAERARLASDPSYMALVLTAGRSFPAAVPLGSAEAIESKVQRWKQQVSALPTNTVGPYFEAGKDLRRAIWDPIESSVGSARRVFIVPDGALQLVSFAALPTAADRYLIERDLTFHYLSAERDIVRLRLPRPPSSGLLAVGGVDFDGAPLARPEIAALGEPLFRGAVPSCAGFRSLRFPPLPSAGAEVEEIAGLWTRRGGSDREELTELIGRDASETRFKRVARGKRILHLATHGFFIQCGPATASQGHVDSNPLFLSGLALAGANRRSDADRDEQTDDGILTAEEIASLDLRGVEWVVLSACETGVGAVRTGEGVLGLRRAFEVAGASTLIMSLWPVPDHPARAWMHALYENRFRGLSTAESVSAADREVIAARRKAGLIAHPFFWGAFVAAGDWR